MELTTIALYVIAVSAVTIIPGPTMLLALSNGAQGGMRLALFGIAGAALSDLLLIGAVALGLGGVLLASEKLFLVVKWGGVIYLMYLAWKLWKASAQPVGVPTSKSTPLDEKSAFKRSLFVALSNPKGLLFFSAFLPQFINTNSNVLSQYFTLAVITALIDIALMSAYAISGYFSMRYFSSQALLWLNRISACTLGGIGLALTFYRRNDLQ
nr:LysE family translocator [Herbaspirillum sp. ASV7]